MTDAQLLKAYRARRGWCQAEAAGAFGVPVRTYQGWEAGRSLPQASMIRHLLCEVLAAGDAPAPD